MQDNNKNKLVDRGWGAMQLVLDKEMPQKKKRRFFVWWLFGGLLMVSAAALFFYSGSDKNITDQKNIATIDKQAIEPNDKTKHIAPADNVDKLKEELAQTQIESKEVEQLKDAKREIQKIEQDKFSTIEETNKSASDLEGLNTGAQKSSSSKNSNSTESLELKTIINKTKAQLQGEPLANSVRSNPISNIATDKAVVFDKEVKEDQDKTNNLLDANDRSITDEIVEERNSINVNSISRLGQINPLLFDREFIASIEPVSTNSNFGYWYSDVRANGSWNPGVNLFGLSAGADFGYSFNDKIDFGASLGLGSFKYAQSTKDQSLINSTGRVKVSVAESENILNSSLRNVSFVSGGAHVGIRLSTRFKVRAGGGYRYLFTSMFDQNATQLSMDNGFSTAAETEMDIETAGGATFDFNYELKKKWFPYAGVGLSYSMNDRLGIDLSYEKVSGSLFENSANPLSMDQLQLGFRYRLK